jgi:hypothetical protein
MIEVATIENIDQKSTFELIPSINDGIMSKPIEPVEMISIKSDIGFFSWLTKDTNSQLLSLLEGRLQGMVMKDYGTKLLSTWLSINEVSVLIKSDCPLQVLEDNLNSWISK